MITFENVSFSYPGGSPIFRDMNLKVRPGITTAIMGPSGSGKTTLLKLACGLLMPIKGGVFRESTNVTAGLIRGVVFHDDTLLPWLTVQENITIGPADISTARAKSLHLLEIFGLIDAAKAYPHELSEGMRKRVEFARALISDTSVLLLDEPFVSLDHTTRVLLWKFWNTSPEMTNRTAILISHDLEEISTIADEVVLIEAGQPVSVQAPVEVSLIKGQINLLEDLAATIKTSDAQPIERRI